MEIKVIKKQKNGFYKIVGNKEIVLADELIIKHNILFNREIDDDLVYDLIKENYKYEILNKAIKYISIKMRSKMEIEKYLNKYELNKDDYNFIIEKLINLNLINDLKYTECYIYDHFNLTSDGPNKIKKDLLNHRIDELIIDDYLSKIKHEEIILKLQKLMQKKINVNHKYSKNQFKKKIEIYFYNLGYNIEDIDILFDKLYVSTNEDCLLEKEYNKLYNKYKSKYDLNKLKLTIKQKLYQKGFELDKINEIINKKN